MGEFSYTGRGGGMYYSAEAAAAARESPIHPSAGNSGSCSFFSNAQAHAAHALKKG